MKKKGFALIDLLAVIIILAIIALIATPIILNVVEDDNMVLDAKRPLKSNLIETLLKQYKEGNTVGLVRDGKTDRYYYKGTNEQVANNFLWYGGHQWRVLEFDTKTKTLKLITQQPLTAIQPAASVWTDAASYDSTYINKWLNEEDPNNELDGVFYNSLREDIQKNIVDTTFNIGNPGINDSTVNKKVGMLTLDEYNLAGGKNSYLDIKDWWWLQNRAGSTYVWIVDYDGGWNQGSPSYDAFGVRAVITISDITIHEGDGTLKQNYKVSEKVNNTSLVQVGDYIKVPYEGVDNACGSDNKCMFRVVSKDNDSIKVVLNGLLPNASAYGDTTTITTSHTIYTPLNNFTNGINDEYQYTTNKKFNIGIYDSGKSYESLSGETIEANVGLPVVGEMFSGNDIDVNTNPKTFVDTDLIENPTTSNWYWTMNRYGSANVKVVDEERGLMPAILFNLGGVRAVIFLKAGQDSNLPFTAGDGSPSSPYELKSIEPKQ